MGSDSRYDNIRNRTGISDASAVPNGVTRPPASRSGWKSRREETLLALLLITPAILLILAVNLYPIGYSFYQSLYDVRGLLNRGYIGLRNYADLLSSPNMYRSLGATLYFTLGAVGLQTVFGLLVALALNVPFRGNFLVRSLIIVPWAIPSALGALMWQRFFSAIDGYVNATLRMFGVLNGDINWFLDPFLAMSVVIWVDSWKMIPLYALIFLAALQAVPKELYESAAIEGASKAQSFFYVTLPILKPVIGIVLILRTVLVFQAFDFIYILTAGGPGDSTRVIAYYAYQEAFSFLQRGRGAAIAIIIFVLTGIITYIYMRALRFQNQQEQHS
jgi:multiple sugar transport system permease protein